eukprot:5337208-Prymnesium_polylepis.1
MTTNEVTDKSSIQERSLHTDSGGHAEARTMARTSTDWHGQAAHTSRQSRTTKPTGPKYVSRSRCSFSAAYAHA